MRTFRITIRGIVQGVGYRWFVRAAAQRLGVTGWVRNMPDGSVEAVAAFPDHSVREEFLDALREGPALSSVSDVEAVPINDPTEYDEFTMVH